MRIVRVAFPFLALFVAMTAGDATSTHTTGPYPLNTDSASDTKNDLYPQVVTDGAGNWVAVWERETSSSPYSDVMVSRSADNGASWTAPVVLNSGTLALNAFVATDRLGVWVVAWSEPGPNAYFSRSTDAASTWSAPQPLLPGTNSGVSTIVASSSAWIVAWSGGGSNPEESEIHYARSTDAGASWVAMGLLNSDAAVDGFRDDFSPKLATDANANWVAVWQVGYGCDCPMSAHSTDNGASWSTPQALDLTGTNVATATDGAGAWVAVWQSLDTDADRDFDIRRAVSTNNGASWTAADFANPNAATDSADDTFPELVAAESRWIVTWDSAGMEGDIAVSVSVDNGTSWNGPGFINPWAAVDDARESFPAIATDGFGNWITIWTFFDPPGGWSRPGGSLGSDVDLLVSDCPRMGTDPDNDAVPSVCDNCPTDANGDQLDTDGNGVGDACDADDDDDGVTDAVDLCPATSPGATVDANGCSDKQVDTDLDGVCNPGPPSEGPSGCAGSDLCQGTAMGAMGAAVDSNGCSDYQVDPDGDGWCIPAAPSPGPSGCSGTDNCPTVSNADQTDSDGDGRGDVCDDGLGTGDSDGDGFSDAEEAGVPLCVSTGTSFHDVEDGAVNDGCPALGSPETACGSNDDDDGDTRVNDGCPRVGQYSEGEFSIGTHPFERCEAGATSVPSAHWPADLVSSGFSLDKVNVLDIGSFITPVRRLNSTAGGTGFHSRWDLMPGTTFGASMINIVDISFVAQVRPSMPPFNGARAFNGPACTNGP